MKKIMKNLLTLLFLFVTLGVAQAYSPPEESEIQVIEMDMAYDLSDFAFNAPVVANAISEIIIYSHSAEISSDSEIFVLAELPGEYLFKRDDFSDTRLTALNFNNHCRPLSNDIFANRYQRYFEKDHRTLEQIRHLGSELVPPVPWRSLKRSTIHHHFHS